MTFHDTGKFLPKPIRSYQIGPALRVADIMAAAPADIMKHRTLFHEIKIDIWIPGCIIAGTVPHSPAMGHNTGTAPGITQQIFAGLFLLLRHDQAIS
jgi:hypothetical protein